MTGRTIALVVVTSTLSGFCGGAALVAALALTPQVIPWLGRFPATPSVNDTVTAHRFVLVNGQGRMLATLQSWKDGTTALVFLAPGEQLNEEKLNKDSSKLLSSVAGDLERDAAAGIVISPDGFVSNGREAKLFLNEIQSGRSVGYASVSAEPDSSSVVVSQPAGPAIKLSADGSTKSASVELSPKASAGEPNSLDPVRYARLDGTDSKFTTSMARQQFRPELYRCSTLIWLPGRKRLPNIMR